MVFKLFAPPAIAQAVEARIRGIIAALDEDKVAHDAGASMDQGSAPRLIQHVRTDVAVCGDGADWTEITVGFASLDPGVAEELWSLIVVPRTLRVFSSAEVSVVEPVRPTSP